MKLNITYIFTKISEELKSMSQHLEMTVLSVWNEEGFIFKREVFKTEPLDFNSRGNEHTGFRVVNFIEQNQMAEIDFVSIEGEYNRLEVADTTSKTTEILRYFNNDDLVQSLATKTHENSICIQQTKAVDTYVSMFSHELDVKPNGRSL